ncbi:MAG TPA: hypothetical protein VFZ91_10070 [Allosphingosinicella sp.]
MNRRLLVLPLAAMAAAAPAAAEKQPPLIPDWKQSHFEEGNVAVRSLYRLAVCAKIQKRETAEALLATAPGSAREAELVQAVMPSGLTKCPIRTNRLTISGRMLVRGAIAEALYNGDDIKPRTASALPLAEVFQPSRYGSELVVAKWVARCAVRREPRIAHEVVKWNPGGIGEGRALRSLKPTFTTCLPAGERLQVSRLQIRALIAEELYRASLTFKESFTDAKG